MYFQTPCFFLRDGKQPYADSWSKSYRITSDFRDRENKTFAPCFTYDNPNEYMMGKNNATVSIFYKNIIRKKVTIF